MRHDGKVGCLKSGYIFAGGIVKAGVLELCPTLAPVFLSNRLTTNVPGPEPDSHIYTLALVTMKLEDGLN